MGNNRQKYKISRQSQSKKTSKSQNQIKLGKAKPNQKARIIAVQRVSQKSKRITCFTQRRLRKSDQRSDKDKTEMQILNMQGMTRYNEVQVCGNGEGEWQTGEHTNTMSEVNN